MVQVYVALWSNGRTPASEAVSLGSIPSRAANFIGDTI